MRRRPQGEHGVRGHTPGPPRQAFVQPRVDQARSCAYKPRNSGEGSADISRGGPRRPACPTATTISTIEPARTRSVHLPARGPGRPTLGAAPAGWASGGGVGAPSCTPGRGADGRAAGARVGPRSLPSGPSSRCPRPAQVRLRHAGRPSRAWRGGIRGGAGRHRAVWLAVTALLSSHLSAHAAAGTPAPAADYRRLSSSARPPATGIGPDAGSEHWS